MEYSFCGKSGLQLPKLSLGCWHNFGDNDNLEEAEKMICSAFEAGITHFDLANNYGPPPGAAEINFGKIFASQLKNHRDEIIVSSKAGHLMWDGPYGDGGSRKNLMASINQSLKRTGLDYFDIFYSHRYDPQTPIEETMQALVDIVKQGKAIYVGISKYPKEQALKSYQYLKEQHIPCLVYQGKYNLLERTPEQEIFPLNEQQGVGFISFSPLAQGILTNRYLNGIPKDSRAAKGGFLTAAQITPGIVEKMNLLNQVAAMRNQSLAEMALAWVLNKKNVSSVIVGTSSVRQLQDNLIVIAILLCSCAKKEQGFNVNKNLEYCHEQVLKTLGEIGNATMMPRNILKGEEHWNLRNVGIGEWTIGFWPGILWYTYEASNDEKIKQSAIHYTELLEPLTKVSAHDHDLGFQIFCSYGNAYRLTGKEEYKQIILNAADTLVTLFNPTVGTILSWPREVKRNGWLHNTIIDNMMNLDMLYWASRNGGSKELYDIATSHAETTMKYHFRPDGGCYHVAVYDTISGCFIKGVTHQGYADSSLWARGQAWGIYGYTLVYRETGNKKFLRFAEKIADLYLSRLPQGEYVPYWDFDAPNIPNEPKDASAAAIVASALLELSELEDSKKKAMDYKHAAVRMLVELSFEKYQSRDFNPSFLLHSTGHWPNNSEIDASIIYADYYYIEALARYKKILEGKQVGF